MIGEEILYSKEDGIGTITINRPEKMNSVTDDMLVDLTNLLNDITLDTKVRALIITGTGRAFCAGTDLSVGVARDQEKAGAERAAKIKNVDLPETTLPRWTFTRLPIPTIAAVNGAAVGMGAEWTAQCDFRIASENARFGWVFPKRAIVPDAGTGPYLLPHIVGLTNALDLMYSGDIIDAQEALRIGLVSKVVPPDQLLSASLEMADRMSAGAPLSLRGIKALTYGALEWPYDKHFEQHGIHFRRTASSEDSKEGVASFFEKRPPVWKGR
jgi:enoyl-CoA hydratase/carnithine racemase